MAYIPETKDKTVRVSPAAQRALGPEDPRARKEVEAQKNQKFSTWDQIGMAADMLPGGAMAVRGGRQIAEAVLSAVQSGTVQDAMKLAANAAKTDKDVLRQALQHLDRAFTEAKRVKQEGAEAVYTAAKNSIEAVLDRTLDVRGRAKSAEHKAAKETMRREGREPSTLGQSTPKPGSALEYVRQRKKIGKDIEASKATTDIMATKDLPSATRMKARDMPSPSGRNRVDQSGLERLAFNVDDISSMTDDQVKYWIELESNMKPMDASTTQRQNEKLRLLMQEAKKRGLR